MPAPSAAASSVLSPRPASAVTSVRARTVAMGAYLTALVTWSAFIGIPNDPIGVFLWIWLSMIAWNIQASREFHLRFPRDWWPVLLGLVIYWLTRGLADEVGIPVHITMPIRFDEWLGGGVTPTERLQTAWCGDPCMKSSESRWYDLFFTSVYATHFPAGLVIAAVLWVRNRHEWVRWMRRYLALSYSALVIYLVYPMAPPWMASRDGFMPDVSRITSRGWSDIGLSRANIVLQGMGNQVAAMPSLHAGFTFLIAFYGIWRLHSPLRWLLGLYPLAMSTALVYFAEHYVVDIIAGALLAGPVMIGSWWWEDRRGAATPGRGDRLDLPRAPTSEPSAPR